MSQPHPPINLAPIKALYAEDFSGGLNVAVAPAQVDDTDSPSCLNFTMDEKGGVVMRLGLFRLNADPLAGVVKYMTYSAALDLFLLQIADTLYTTPDFVTITSIHTFTTAARCNACDYVDKLAVVHPNDGVFSYDGATWALQTNAVKGSCVAAWQNKLWVAGDIRAGNHAIVWWSNPGTFVFTTATDFNGIREKNGKLITALGIGNGVDIAGRPGLLVFKDDSFYRINDSTTGAYTTMHAGVGCVGPNAVQTTLDGLIIFFSRTGIYTTDGVTPGAVLVSQKLQPYFTRQQINMALLDGVCAGVTNDRVVFSFPWGATATENTRTIEYHPAAGWMMPHDFGASSFVTYTKNTLKLYSSSPTTAYVRDTFVGGDDEGTPITARFQTRWYSGGLQGPARQWSSPEQGYLMSLQRLRLNGSGRFDLYVKTDYDLGRGTLIEQDVQFDGGGFVWNDVDDLWNTASFVWGQPVYSAFHDFYDLGPCKTFSFVFEKTSSTSRSGPDLGGDGAGPEVGACAIYSILVDYVRLGLA